MRERSTQAVETFTSFYSPIRRFPRSRQSTAPRDRADPPLSDVSPNRPWA